VRDWLLQSRDNRAGERLFIFTLIATDLSEGCSTQTALCSQLSGLADANRQEGQLIRAVRHFLIIVDELMNEAK